MGGSCGKEDCRDVCEVVETSSGFHLFELHMTSVGISIFAALLIIACIIMFYYCLRRREQLSRNNREASIYTGNPLWENNRYRRRNIIFDNHRFEEIPMAPAPRPAQRRVENNEEEYVPLP